MCHISSHPAPKLRPGLLLALSLTSCAVALVLAAACSSGGGSAPPTGDSLVWDQGSWDQAPWAN